MSLVMIFVFIDLFLHRLVAVVPTRPCSGAFSCLDNGLLCCLLPCRFHCLSFGCPLPFQESPPSPLDRYPSTLFEECHLRENCAASSLHCIFLFCCNETSLLQVVDSEIKYALESDDYDRVEEIPGGFPFEIQDEKGMNTVTLKRNYHGERIEVIVSMPSLVTGEEPDNEPDNNDEDGDQSERASQSSIPLTVVVSKGKGPSLEFSCAAYPDEVTIDSMSVRENKESDDEMLAYEGPDFNDLDENLQKSFHKYLEIRGISPLTTNFMHEYMINKDSREYLLWLKNLKQFIQK